MWTAQYHLKHRIQLKQNAVSLFFDGLFQYADPDTLEKAGVGGKKHEISEYVFGGRLFYDRPPCPPPGSAIGLCV